ncbi:MAG: type II secretion system F family protein [Anaerolineales bacterium]|nr:type II secretion system F family protein [Anaerolineales bacterium]
MNIIIIIGAILSVILLVIGIVITVRDEQSVLDDRFSHYVEEEFEDAVALAEEQKISAFSVWLDNKLEGSQYGDRIATGLAQADLKLRPAEFMSAIVIASFLLGFFAWAIGGQNIISALIGAVLGGMAPRMYMKRQQNKRITTFGNQLPDMLNLTVNGLRAGYSTMQALESVSKELPPPLSDEFNRVVKEMQLGISMDAALNNMHRRIPSDDLDLIITAINVQREVGGNLAEILDMISYTIRERIKIKGEIKVLVSQVIYSGRFLALLPLILMGLLWFANREYLLTFFSPGNLLCGGIMLGIAAIMVASGYIVMNKLADIEV